MKLDKKNVVFLLGGHDLEMQEIRSVLEREEIAFYDKELSWNNANLSAYKNKLNKYTTYYAIELTIDLTGYDNVHIIDHHGNLSNNDASLLQVLQLLDKKPTCWQELVAANDARYIQGMECIGATQNEIASIRKEDRKAQGVKHSDELAGKNDAKSKKIQNNIAIVSATTPYFSTITDSLYLQEEWKGKSIIYNHEKMVLYGFSTTVLEKLCKKLDISKEDYYSGGGEYGYFGFKDEVLNKEKRGVIMEDLTKENALYSSHIFMFPFRFDWADSSIVNTKSETIHEYEFYYEKPIEERIHLNDMEDKLKEEDWIYEPYTIHANEDEMHLAYNEFAYFYDYAKDTLYNRDYFDNDAISSFFRKKDENGDNLYEGDSYIIDVNNVENGNVIGSTTYELKIKGVSLRIFHTGIAILSIEADNHTYAEMKDVLRINDYGRRIYPQYIGTDKECTTKKSFLPNYIKIGSNDKENFTTFEYNDIEIGNHIMQVLGKKVFADKKAFKEKKDDYHRFYIQPSLDDRMFVMSWYGDDALIGELCTCYNYKDSDDWYKYVFVDTGNDATVQNEMMKKNLLDESTYDRWSGYSTLYGITRYSFVLLTSSEKSLIQYNARFLIEHMNTMYFQMATLLLANRTSILRFSDEIAALVSPTKKQQEVEFYIKTHTSKLSTLYDIYLKYYNRLYFKEVTHQDQGIELYDIGIKQMRIGNHVEKLDGKFEKLFNVETLKSEKSKRIEEEKQNKIKEEENNIKDKFNNQLTMLGAIFLLPSLMLGLLGMSIFDYTGIENGIWWVIVPLISSIFAGYSWIKKCYGCAITLFFVPLLVVYFNLAKLHDTSVTHTQSSQHKGENNVRR